MSITAIMTSTKTRSFFLSLLNKATTLSHISQIQAQLLHHSLHHDLSTSTKLTHKLFDLNATRHALSVFFFFPNPDIFLVNVLIKGLAKNNQPGKALSVFRILRKEYPDLKCNSLTYTFVVAAASLIPDSRIGYLIHCNAIVDGFCSDLSFGSAVIAFYFKVWREDLARKVFDNLPQRDTVVCNTMISGYARSSFFTDSVRVFNDMLSGNGPFIDCTSVIAVLPAVAELVELRLGMGVHCLALKSGFHSHLSVTTGLISLYTKCGEIETARFLFNGIGRKDVISCNAMISGFTCNGDAESSVRLFIEWLSSGGKVNSSTIVGLIPVYSPFGHLRFIECIHGFSVKFGVVSDSSVSTALTTVYSRLNEIESARQLFDESKEKTLASWNAMISGYTQNGLTERAISLFHEMLTYDINPNPVTVTSILSACSQLGTLSLGKWIHHSLVKSKSFESNVYVLTALIDMYAKCGSIEEARRLFDAMTEKNEVTWNAMIAGYGLHGHGNEALKLYYDMLDSAIRPTSVTFLTILYACSHAGLVSEGDEIFRSIRDYGLEPLPEHYACMVDILGRAGQLDEALEFIKGMPSEPGPQVWGALLGSCMIHKNTNIARIASDRLFELDPSNMGYYVLMSNIYSTERNYPQAASVRQVAKRRNLAKTPGCTLIEVGQTPHVFTSGDQSHPQSESIYSKLDALNAKMYDLGYQPETATALHDVEEEEKELMVKVHSEKLAIAFGLISTEPGSEIRIIKNLRVCLDCHTATKFISKITKRVIVVRDANRFHHFKDGVCSCGDYW